MHPSVNFATILLRKTVRRCHSGTMLHPAFRTVPLLLTFAVILGANRPSLASTLEGALPVVVNDNRTHLPVANARVCIGADSLCAQCDSAGAVTLTGLQPGRFDVRVTAAGYETAIARNVVIHKGTNYQLIVAMDKSSVVDLGKMTVTSWKAGRSQPSQSTSVSRLTSFELSNTPGTADDIGRVLATNPAVVSSINTADDNTMYVRGGGSNENVFVFDGLELDNASHFSDVDKSGGAMSFLSGTLVRELDFYTGGFPAAFPPRLSSVVDMRLRTGSFTNYKMETEANIAGLGFTCEGPIAKKASFLTSVRMVDLSSLDRFLHLEGVPRFGDGMLKLVYIPNQSHSFRALALGAVDNYHEKYDPYGFRFPTSYDEWIYQGGGIADWTWNTETIKNVLSASGSGRREFSHDDAIDENEAMKPDTFIANLSEWGRTNTLIDSLLLPTDTLYFQILRYTGGRLWETTDLRWRIMAKDRFTLLLGDRDQLEAGCSFETNRYRICKESASEAQDLYIYSNNGEQVVEPKGSWHSFSIDSALYVQHAGGYAEYVFDREWIKVLAGLRGDYYTVLTDYGLSPRLGVQFNPSAAIGRFSMSGGLYFQFPSDFSGLISDIITMYPNVKTSGAPLEDARLQRNWQGVVRYERQAGEHHQVSLESYYKWYDREFPLISPDNRLYGEWGRDSFRWLIDKANGKKRAYGLEAVLGRNTFDRLYYTCSYALFNVENRYTNKKWYNDENNVAMVGNLTVGSNFAKHHGLSLRLTASGGRPYSAIQRVGPGNSFEYDTAKGYYTERLDPLLSASCRYSFTFDRTWGSMTGYIEIWNLFNQTSVMQRYFNGSSGYEDMHLNGIIPIAGVKVYF
jgi:hypothetical protein